MKNNNIYVKKKLVYDNEISELDFELHGEFGFDYEESDDFIIQHEGGDNEGYPIKIESVIQELVNMKECGATHVAIDYHCDHIGYIFEGFNIRTLTPSEITELEDQNQKKMLNSV